MSKHEKDTGNDESLIDWGNWNNPPTLVSALFYTFGFILFIIGIMFIITLSYQILNTTFSIDKHLKIWTNFKDAFYMLGSIFAAIVGVWFSVWRLRTADRNADTNAQNHITSNFNKAVELLGATRAVKRLDENNEPYEFTEKSLEIRLGAIYALERIAKNSWEDHWPIMEILTAYIRENSPIAGEFNIEQNLPESNVTEDVQAVITAIGRRNEKWIEEELKNNRVIKIINCNLNGADFSDSNYSGATFRSNTIYETNFRRANLKAVEFDFMVGDMPYFNISKLDLATFKNCSIAGAEFDVADCKNALFIKCDLAESSYKNTILDESSFIQCNLAMTDFDTDIVKNIRFEGSLLVQATFRKASFTGRGIFNCFIHKDFSEIGKIDMDENWLYEHSATLILFKQIFRIIKSAHIPKYIDIDKINLLINRHYKT